MKSIVFTVLWILFSINLVKSEYDDYKDFDAGLYKSYQRHLKDDTRHHDYHHAEHDRTPDSIKSNKNEVVVPKYGIILMGCTIALLFVTVIILLAIIYKLNRKKYKASIICHTTKPTSSNSLIKYNRELSAETTNIPLTPKDNNDDLQFKFSRQNSRMVIADQPTNFDTNGKKPQEQNDAQVLRKVLSQVPIERDQMKRICDGVLSKRQHLNESTSLSDLTKILNENHEVQLSENIATIEKSTSVPLLDLDHTDENELPELKVEEPSNHNSKSMNVKKIKELFNSPPKRNIHKATDDTAEHSHNNKRWLRDNDEAENSDDVYDNPPKYITPVFSLKSDEHVDEVYDNPPKHSRLVSSNDEYVDDIYDNPPKHSRLVSSNDEQVGEIYDNPPKHSRPVPSNNELLDNMYDNPLSGNRPVSTLQAENADSEDIYENPSDSKATLDAYDVPFQCNRAALATDVEIPGYNIVPFNNVRASCFDSQYINAKSYKIPKDK